MKKRLQVAPDISALVIKMQQQLASLEKKIDTLIGLSLSKPSELKPFPKPFQQGPHSHGGGRQDNNYRERIMHKAICADCKKECEVPFKPIEERPVYCKECFSKRKAVRSFKASIDNKPKEAGPAQTIHDNKPQDGKKKKSIGKKKSVSKNRKKR